VYDADDGAKSGRPTPGDKPRAAQPELPPSDTRARDGTCDRTADVPPGSAMQVGGRGAGGNASGCVATLGREVTARGSAAGGKTEKGGRIGRKYVEEGGGDLVASLVDAVRRSIGCAAPSGNPPGAGHTGQRRRSLDQAMQSQVLVLSEWELVCENARRYRRALGTGSGPPVPPLDEVAEELRKFMVAHPEAGSLPSLGTLVTAGAVSLLFPHCASILDMMDVVCHC
jgi:hypothetical protein